MCFGHRENKRWQQCQHVFKKAEERGVEINLNVIMVRCTGVEKGICNFCMQRGMLRPDEIEIIRSRVMVKKVNLFHDKLRSL